MGRKLHIITPNTGNYLHSIPTTIRKHTNFRINKRMFDIMTIFSEIWYIGLCITLLLCWLITAVIHIITAEEGGKAIIIVLLQVLTGVIIPITHKSERINIYDIVFGLIMGIGAIMVARDMTIEVWRPIEKKYKLHIVRFINTLFCLVALLPFIAELKRNFGL